MSGTDVAVQIELAGLEERETYTHETTPSQWARLFSVLISMPAVYVTCRRPMLPGEPPRDEAIDYDITDAEIETVTAEAVTLIERYDNGEQTTTLHYDAMVSFRLDVYPR